MDTEILFWEKGFELGSGDGFITLWVINVTELHT